tara:strand:+ start:156 stop:1943 length:1788 start_codon:yes stop_codon:yes gene_type:complete
MDNEIEILSFSELERFRKENDYYHITDPRNSINTEGQDLSDPKVQQAIIDELMERKKMDVIDEMPISRKAGERIKQRRLEQAGDGKALEANKGGMPKQMEMFADGGLKDEGGTIDPVSGNDVPPGATQEEVRDDIPAKLSEGEFVFPADVVRFIGLEKLMAMRQKAKAGLKRMEEMGQMGNADEATLPDDMPFTIDDIEMEDDENVIKAQTGTFVAPQAPLQRQDSKVVDQFDIRPATPSEITSPSAPVVSSPIEAFDKTRFQGDTPTDSVQTFEELVGTKPGEYDEFRQYKNDAGMILNIPFKNGEPLYPIPEGYVYVEPDKTETEEVTTQEVVPKTTTVTESSDDPEEPEKAKDLVGDDFSYKSLFKMDNLDSTMKDISSLQLNLFDPKRAGVQAFTGQLNVSDITLMGLTSTMEGFKNKPSIIAEYGKNFNLVNLGNAERDELSRVLNVTKDEYENVLTDDKGNALNLDELVEKAQSKYGMTNLTKEQLLQPNTNITSRNKVNTLVNSIVQNEISRKKDIEVTPTPRPTQITTQQPESSDGGYEDTGQSVMSDFGSAEEQADPDFEPVAKGGLLKKKTKVKKMKRGGLASKK